MRCTRLALLAAGLLLVPAPGAAGRTPAPGAPGDKHAWAAADKHGFGTATDVGSRVWFTLRQAELTEAYYPDLGTPSLRDLEFVVTDGRSFVDRESDRNVHASVTPVPASLTYVQTIQTRRWKLTKTWITDPARPAVLANVRFVSRTSRPLRLFVLVDPAPGDDGNDDTARSRRSALSAADEDVASHVAATPALRKTTSGYAETPSDPWRDLDGDGDLDRRYDATEPGNVVQAARTRLTGLAGAQRMVLSVAFGESASQARMTGEAARADPFAATAKRYAAGWASYLGSVERAPGLPVDRPFLRRVYDQSVMVLAASEDKANRGASIASPSMPWVWGTLTLSRLEESGAYHLVWPRDLYHVATAQKLAGDEEASHRLLDYLWRVQKPEGDWWQNTEVQGAKNSDKTQMDQVSLPIVLAWWLGRVSAADWQHVRAAADYVVAHGPRTDQERWENQDGWSPNSIAAQIAGLVCAGDIARRNGDVARAQTYEGKADEWQKNVEAWTATSNGPYDPKPYYVRVTKDGDPDDGSTYELGDNVPRPVEEREIVDNSFLGLVLWGVKRHDDKTVLNSLAVGDRQLRADTPHGPLWQRFTFDGYGETRTGADWDIFEEAGNQTLGRAWPLLTGERGEYELLAGRDAKPSLRTIARTANDGLMLPEQVWDGRRPSPSPEHPEGEGTRSATPLAWTHGQYIRLAWSIAAGEPLERPAIVACRYTGTAC